MLQQNLTVEVRTQTCPSQLNNVANPLNVVSQKQKSPQVLQLAGFLYIQFN